MNIIDAKEFVFLNEEGYITIVVVQTFVIFLLTFVVFCRKSSNTAEVKKPNKVKSNDQLKRFSEDKTAEEKKNSSDNLSAIKEDKEDERENCFSMRMKKDEEIKNYNQIKQDLQSKTNTKVNTKTKKKFANNSDHDEANAGWHVIKRGKAIPKEGE